MTDFLKRSAIQFGIWLAISGVVVLLVILQNPNEFRLEIGKPQRIASQSVDRLWFSGRGELFGVRRHGDEITVLRFSLDGAPPVTQVIKLPSDNVDVWTVSKDGDAAAWYSGNELSVVPVFSGQIRRVSVPFSPEPKLLALLDNGLAVAVSDAGGVALLDRRKLDSVANGTVRVAHPDVIEASGNYLAIGARASGTVEVVDTRAIPKISVAESRIFPLPFSALALSSTGRVAVATGNGPVLAQHPVAVGPTYGLSFVDDARLVVVGEFRGAKLIEGKKDLLDLSPMETVGRSIATMPGLVAIGSADNIQLVSLHDLSGMAEVNRRIIRLWIILNLVILITLLTRFILMMWKAGRKKSQFRDKECAVDLTNTLASTSVPEDLQIALTNGNCVLLAGDGLTVAAGYPDWQVFLQSFVHRLTGGESLPAERAAVLYRAKTAEAICKTVEGSDHAMLEYARQVYLGAGSISTIHHLLSVMPFAAALTSMFDRSLERTFAVRQPVLASPSDASRLTTALNRKTFLLVRSRGDLNVPQSVHLTQPGAPSDDVQFRGFLNEVFETKKVLFMGATLDEVESWASALSKRDARPHRHFALVPVTSPDWMERAEVLQRDHRIHFFSYPAQDVASLVQFLGKLAAAMPGNTAAVATA